VTTSTARRLAGRLGALSVHSRGRTNTLPARQAFNERFEREVDPTGSLDPKERARRAAHAKAAYFTRLAMASAKARAGRNYCPQPGRDRSRRSGRGAA
jgi:hypothetical protein